MRALAIDPGAERCGWAVLEHGPVMIDSGIIRFPREGMDFQKYRVALEWFFYDAFEQVMDYHDVDVAVNETIPAVGGGNFVVATQSYLANCVVATYHVCAYKRGLPVVQQGATTMQSRIALRSGKGKKVSKVQVRNGVVSIMPSLKPRVREWTKEFDEVDAIAHGLTYLGYRVHDFV